MVRRRRAFLIWSLVLSALWVLLNWPQDGGPLKRLLGGKWAGFPWTFVAWDADRLEFAPAYFAADAGLGVLMVLSVAGLCAWCRRGDQDPAAMHVGPPTNS